MFSDTQIKELTAPLLTSNVKKNPRGYDYVEGWHAIAEANRIFGFASWDRQTIETIQLGEPEKVGENWRVAYRCRVRIIVRAGDTEIIRDGSGYGSGIVKDVRDAHESAVKEAETDAMKRALMTFGNPFGLALYDKAKSNVATEPDSRDLFMAACKAKIASFTIAEELANWWKSEEQMKIRRDFDLNASEVDVLKALVISKRNALSPQKVTA